jgi:biotin carboxylase
MKKIVIIGANSFQNPLILKAKNMGYETHVFAWKDGSIGEKTADYFYPISILEKDKILGMCRKIKPEAITTIASDLATITVNYVAHKLNLPCNSPHCTLISTNKYKMREALKKASIPTPNFLTTSDDSIEISSMNYPIIVKPTDRSGSRGITKLFNSSNLKEAIKVSVENSFEGKAIVEEYIEGDEYSCECISYNGKHHFLALTKKFTTGSPHFIETAHMEPSGFTKELEERIISTIFAALDSLMIEYGASHSEFKVTKNGDIRIIEIGARMGGDCIGSDLVNISTGLDYLRMVIDVACGREPLFEKISTPRVGLVKFIFTQDDLNLLNDIKENYPNLIHYISDIDTIGSHSIVDSSTRYGYFILSCNSIKEAKELLTL